MATEMRKNSTCKLSGICSLHSIIILAPIPITTIFIYLIDSSVLNLMVLKEAGAKRVTLSVLARKSIFIAKKCLCVRCSTSWEPLTLLFMFLRRMSSAFLANLNCRPSVCLSSVTLVHPTHPAEIFHNVSTPFGTLAILDIHGKFDGDRPRGTLPSGGGMRGVTKHSDFGPIEGYISETVQDRR